MSGYGRAPSGNVQDLHQGGTVVRRILSISMRLCLVVFYSLSIILNTGRREQYIWSLPLNTQAPLEYIHPSLQILIISIISGNEWETLVWVFGIRNRSKDFSKLNSNNSCSKLAHTAHMSPIICIRNRRVIAQF